MTKVKIIANWNEHNVERDVNQFIATHNVVNIKFQATGSSGAGKTYAVMIVYEEC